MNALVLEVSDALGEVGDADGLEGLVVWVRSNAAKLSGVREMRAPWILARAMQVWHAYSACDITPRVREMRAPWILARAMKARKPSACTLSPEL